MADDGWTNTPLGELVDVLRDVVDPRRYPQERFLHFSIPAFDEGRRPYVQLGAEIGSQKLLVVDDCLLLSRLNPRISRVWHVAALNGLRGVASTEFLVCRARRQSADNQFLRYVFQTPAFVEALKGQASGTSGSHQRVRREDVLSVLVSTPSLLEQRAIGAVLSAIDDKIELNRRMAQTLEEMARALFKSWFIDFDPVRAKAEGRDPGLPEHLADLFPDRIVNSELGEIPDGWDSAALSDVATLTQRSIKPGSHPDRAWAHFSIPAFDAGRMPFSEFGRQIKSGKYRVPSVCVLISKLNPSTPRVWLPDVTDEEWSICSTEFLPFVPVRVEWRSFLYELLRSAPFEEAVLSRVSGSTGSRQRVLPGDVASLRFVRPDDALIGEFSRLATHWHERTLAAMREAAELSALRELLLPLLVSGELRLPDPEGLLARLEAVG